MSNKKNKIIFCTLLTIFLFPLVSWGHPMDDVLKNMSRTDIGSIYFKLGFEHIIPLGLDHILFVVCVFLLQPKLKTVIWQATAFTVAHSITLGLAMYQIIEPPIHIVEPIIALSIAFVAIENIIVDKLKPARIVLIFIFGLIHGVGFASVLTDLGLPQKEFFTSLITFNLGVELGQITVIIACWLLFGKWFSEKPWYKKRIVIPLSAIIGLIGLYWTIERIFFNS